MSKIDDLQSLTSEVRTLTAGLVSRELTRALVDLEKWDRQVLTLSEEGQEPRLAHTAAKMAGTLATVARELNMPETQKRIESAAAAAAAAAQLKGHDLKPLSKGTRLSMGRMKDYVSWLKREAELGESNPAADKAMSDIAFTLGMVADDLGIGRASSLFESASSSARQGH